MNEKYIIHYRDSDAKKIPNYADYGHVINSIKEKLSQQLEIPFFLYADDETSNEIWEVLEEDLLEDKEEVYLFSNIFEGLETYTISSDHTAEKLELIVKPRLTNAIYYYPAFKVALARTPVFQYHNENTHDFILAHNNECIIEFLHYILRRKKEYTKNNVTVFTDTQDGVRRDIERISTLVT